jgi:threonyl-tRNA synthetase
MNCPSHYLMYLAGKHSYRELPLRYSTYDVLHRNELSGALSGLTRVRQFQQDDCHIFLMESQIADEVKRLVDFIIAYYRTFALTAELKFCTRPAVRIGDDGMWDRAEAALRGALDATGLAYATNPGDGAFYGPKIDFHVADSIGRTWQLGTIQLDYAAPERSAMTLVRTTRASPIVIHRAVSGSFERFAAILVGTSRAPSRSGWRVRVLPSRKASWRRRARPPAVARRRSAHTWMSATKSEHKVRDGEVQRSAIPRGG